MGRELRGKLPMMNDSQTPSSLERARARDSHQKSRSKEYFDKRFHAKHSTIQAGDKVLLRQVKKNKLTTTFDARPSRVVHVKGTAAIIVRGQQKLMRNMRFLNPS